MRPTLSPGLTLENCGKVSTAVTISLTLASAKKQYENKAMYCVVFVKRLLFDGTKFANAKPDPWSISGLSSFSLVLKVGWATRKTNNVMKVVCDWGRDVKIEFVSISEFFVFEPIVLCSYLDCPNNESKPKETIFVERPIDCHKSVAIFRVGSNRRAFELGLSTIDRFRILSFEGGIAIAKADFGTLFFLYWVWHERQFCSVRSESMCLGLSLAKWCWSTSSVCVGRKWMQVLFNKSKWKKISILVRIVTLSAVLLKSTRFCDQE